MFRPIVLTVACLSSWASLAGAIPVDGRLDPEYGSPLSVQTTQTDAGDNLANYIGYTEGCELDQGFAFVSGGTLHLLFAGNVRFCCPTMFNGEGDLYVFLDSGVGGQNTLRADNPDVGPYAATFRRLAGLTFDADFSPDVAVACTAFGTAYYTELPAAGGGAAYYLGRDDGTGTLTGGTNPYGIQLAVDDTNIAGVSAGCSTGSGAGVTTGAEWAVPLAALGPPAGPIRVCALFAQTRPQLITNQVLGPLPPGTCNLGEPTAVNFANLAGAQYFEVPLTTSAPPTAAAGFGIDGVWPNPARATALSVAFRLAASGRVRIELLDVMGRRVATHEAGSLGPGWYRVPIDTRDMPAGAYQVRLRQGARSATTQVTLVK